MAGSDRRRSSAASAVCSDAARGLIRGRKIGGLDCGACLVSERRQRPTSADHRFQLGRDPFDLRACRREELPRISAQRRQVALLDDALDVGEELVAPVEAVGNPGDDLRECPQRGFRAFQDLRHPIPHRRQRRGHRRNIRPIRREPELHRRRGILRRIEQQYASPVTGLPTTWARTLGNMPEHRLSAGSARRSRQRCEAIEEHVEVDLDIVRSRVSTPTSVTRPIDTPL